jgi:hypothetical protein
LIHINANTAKRVGLSILHAGQRCSASFGDLAVFSFDCPAIAGHRPGGAGRFFQLTVTAAQTNPALNRPLCLDGNDAGFFRWPRCPRREVATLASQAIDMP